MPFFNGSSTQNSSHISAHTNLPSLKDPSTEYSHIISHKACLFNNSSLQTIHSSSPKSCLFACCFSCTFSMALPHKIQVTYPPTQTMPSFRALPQIVHISSHTNHALFERLFHRKFTHPLTQHMSFFKTSFNETKAAYVKELPKKLNPV